MNKILLHSCCAPCSGAIIEYMVKNGIRPTVFFSNSNIVPKEEYELRKAEIIRYCKEFGLEVIEDDYNHDGWLDYVFEGKKIREMGAEPERGSRCTACFRCRLLRAARYAAEYGFDTVTTSLASSRWKDLGQVNAAGVWACEQVAATFPKTASAPSFWEMNWRKGGLQPRRCEIIREQNFYNQTFCGCEFSLKK